MAPPPSLSAAVPCAAGAAIGGQKRGRARFDPLWAGVPGLNSTPQYGEVLYVVARAIRGTFGGRARRFSFLAGPFLPVHCRVEWAGRRTARLPEDHMPLTVEAIYENGVLKPAQPLPLKEHEKVQVTIHTPADRAGPTPGVIPCADLQLVEWAALASEPAYPPPREEP